MCLHWGLKKASEGTEEARPGMVGLPQRISTASKKGKESVAQAWERVEPGQESLDVGSTKSFSYLQGHGAQWQRACLAHRNPWFYSSVKMVMLMIIMMIIINNNFQLL